MKGCEGEGQVGEIKTKDGNIVIADCVVYFADESR